jgi:hypothetical protein
MLDIIATIIATMVMLSLNARITKNLLEKHKEDSDRDRAITKLGGMLSSGFLLGIIVWAIWS